MSDLNDILPTICPGKFLLSETHFSHDSLNNGFIKFDSYFCSINAEALFWTLALTPENARQIPMSTPLEVTTLLGLQRKTALQTNQ